MSASTSAATIVDVAPPTVDVYATLLDSIASIATATRVLTTHVKALQKESTKKVSKPKVEKAVKAEKAAKVAKVGKVAKVVDETASDAIAAPAPVAAAEHVVIDGNDVVIELK